LMTLVTKISNQPLAPAILVGLFALIALATTKEKAHTRPTT